jgi:hypothetical protein
MRHGFDWRRTAGTIIVGGILLAVGLVTYVMVQSRADAPAPHSPALGTDPVAIMDHAGCYTIVASGNELHGRSHVLELRADSLPGVAGFYVLGVPAPARGAPVSSGGWTIQRDSVFIMWRDDHAGFSMTLGTGGDTLRGHMLPAQWTHPRGGFAPRADDATRDGAGDVTASRSDCGDGEMVPARNVFDRPPQRPSPASRPRVS